MPGEVRHIRRVSDRLMALIALGLFFVVAAVLLARTTDNIIVAEPPVGSLLQGKILLFNDGPNGEVAISDEATGAVVRTLYAGEGSFIRGVVRSLVRTRHQQGLFEQTGFHLNLYQDGRLQLVDPLTSQVIDLVAFGPTNMAEFADLLTSEPGGSLMAGST
ncbi:MAG: photosynthetic complex assembly protein PuhC [Luminiphilus sp.]|nr:photosynthetic complex assembly protein PuhC [Luminiphilus sp.]